jgi:glycosyltransferase involved in cell wall biosynthesis
MSAGSNMISVIIATTCEKRREREIQRAVASVLDQEGVPVELILVVNGERFDPGLLQSLRENPRLRVEYRQQGSFPAALRHGREVIRGEYFAFLDDDDMYLPGALRIRLDGINDGSPVDWMCTNGFEERGGVGVPYMSAEEVAFTLRDPINAQYSVNWLGSSGALFRTTAIPPEFFDGVTKHYEWTWLTYVLLMAGKTVRFVDQPTFYKYDTPGSLSKDKSADPRVTELRLLELMKPGTPPPSWSRLHEKIRGCLHSLASFHCDRGEVGPAWSYHWRSLMEPGGWRYLLYTRKLVAASVRQMARRAPLARAQT